MRVRTDGGGAWVSQGWGIMAFNIRKRGKLTYYSSGDRPVLSALVTEDEPDGDLRIYFAGLTGGYSAKGVLGLDELVTMEPLKEIPLVFRSWEKWLQDAGICDSLKDIDFIEVHAFGCQPKSPNPLVDPAGYAEEQARLRRDYAEAYATFFAEELPDHGLPSRFTVHLVDVPDTAASYEFYSVGLLQRNRNDQ
ncbi:MAG TPA: hypothetical protein VD767_02370 [Thermomicrobiales bacterium]|nr:hypothetical protein [Thermomicrobiales bacterium]